MEGALTAAPRPLPRPGGREHAAAPVGVRAVEAAAAAEVELAAAPRWQLLVLHEGSPVARIKAPAPGPGAGTELATAAIARWADPEIARRRLAAALRVRLGAPPKLRRPASAPTCSVVVCTHRRPHYLPTLLAALAELDPAPSEFIVVDNDPGEQDCRAAVEATGARYVREDRRGLDNARNTGARAARGEIVVFTDDDCVPAPGWLLPLARAFARPEVAAVTGPAFPYELDTPARVRVEQQASLARGLRRVAFDWRVVSPLQAAAIGVGANMAIRRELLESFGPEPFPPELDAGTATESGGDIALLAALMASGRRLLYEPDMFVFHQHRSDWPALRRAVRGYGIGLSAALTKLLVERGELSAPRAWSWLLEQYALTQARRAMGSADAVSTRIAWEYLRGGLLGPARWRRSLAAQRELGAGGRGAASTNVPVSAPPGADELAAAADPPTATGESTADRAADDPAPRAPADAEPAVSVVIPTSAKRPQALARCLGALAAQRGTVPFELLLVDDGSPATLRADELPDGFDAKVIATGGAGAAAARNAGARAARGELLLFLDDDIVAGPDLVATHHRRQAEGPDRVLVGSYMPRARGDTLAATTVALWWSDFFRRMGTAVAQTFVSALTGNLSVPRAAFLASGGFDETFPRSGREDWEWGLRILAAGLEIDYEPGAEAWHEFELGTANRLAAARLEGHGDALIAALHPDAVGSLPVLLHRPGPIGEALLPLGRMLWAAAPLRDALTRVLDALERAKLRQAWWSLFNPLQAAAYAQGLRDGGLRRRELPEPAAIDVALDRDDPIAAPRSVAPLLRLTWRGEEIGRVAPVEGQWSAELAEQVAEWVPWSVLGPLAAARGWAPQAAERSPRTAEVDVVLGPGLAGAAAALAASGANVVELEREGAWWEQIHRLAATGGRELLAIPLPGVRPDRRWLDEALVAFDGERVAVAVGGSLGDTEPLAPLYLHDELPSWRPPGPAPRYLIVRRVLAAELLVPGRRGRDALGCVLAVTRRAAARGWIVAERATHGVVGAAPGRAQRGRAWATELAVELLGAPESGSAPGTPRALIAARAGASIGYESLRRLRRLAASPPRAPAGAAGRAATRTTPARPTSARSAGGARPG